MKRVFRIITTVLFTLLIAVPANAVLKEADLKNTLAILREEITEKHADLLKKAEQRKAINEDIRKQIVSIIHKSSQNGLMLYSQKNDYIFDLTYACHEATEQYHNFASTVMPFESILVSVNEEIERYDSLINVLSDIPAMALDEKARTDRNVCLTLATDSRNQLKQQAEAVEQYKDYFDRVGVDLKEMNDYAMKKYKVIQNSIFKNGGENYFQILSKLGPTVKDTEKTVSEKYKPKKSIMSQWDVRLVLGLFLTIAFYALIAIGCNVLFYRYLFPKKYRSERFKLGRSCITVASSVVTFAIILGILKAFVNQAFFQMASGLLVEYAWLLAVILISMLFRFEHQDNKGEVSMSNLFNFDADRLKSGFRIYAPIIVMGGLVIIFRIILIPNELVNLIFPPILLVCAFWQWRVIKKHNHKLPKNDVLYAYITLLVFIVSVVCSWIGYTLMSVQLLIWWLMELTCIQTITCLLHWLEKYAEKKDIQKLPVSKNWWYYFTKQVVVPILGVVTFLFSIYWAATVFNLTDMTFQAFDYNFVDLPNITLSVKRICMVLILYFIFKYLSKQGKALLRWHFQKSSYENWESKDMMFRNVLQTIIWGAYILISLSILNVGNTWLMVIAGGFSTGIGFAMKDILENIYYGISLMAGRIHIGDTILCDGVMGKVKSISYTSTMLDVEDGSIMAFQNSQLFTKNYKNLTKNHGWELMVVPVGVAYGTDVKKVREMLKENLSKLNCYDKSKGIKVYFADFGDSSVDLKVKCWVHVTNRYVANSQIKEVIYNTLNDNNISIPFPQRDLHIIKDEEINANNLPEKKEDKEFEIPGV